MARDFQENQNLIKELEEGEKVLWKGAPEAFPLMTEDNKKSITSRWLGCIIAAVVLIALYLVISMGTEGVSVWLLILLLVVVAYVAGLPLVDRSKVYKKCKYYITNRRVILHFDEKEIVSLPIAGLKADFVSAEEGCVHVDLGACVGIKGKKRRVASFVPKKDANDHVSGFVIYNVADSKELRAALNK